MIPKGRSLKIVGVKTLDGYYISEMPHETYGTTYFTNYLVNGEVPEKTFNPRWVKVSSEPKLVQRYENQPTINHRYELIDKSLESEKLPNKLNRDEVTYVDGDGDRMWIDDFRHLQSLYELVYDTQPKILVDLDFTYETILEMDELKEANGFSYPIQRTKWSHEGVRQLTQDDVRKRLIDQIAFPSIVHASLPSKITSEQMYKIVRQHVKENIEHSVARITSDYDFCFTVKRRVQLNKPYERKREILKSNGKSYAKPKYDTKYIKEREVEIFEMTHSGSKYKGYTIIEEIEAENLEQLQEKIDTYLEKLMRFINTPVKECSCCDGRGIELNDDVKKWVLNEN